MYYQIVSLVLTSTAFGHPKQQLEQLVKRDLKVGEWAAPTDGQVRGPCPALNTLSNHGYLRRDGGDEPTEKYKSVIKDVYNVGTDVTSVILARAKTIGVLHDSMFSQKDLQRHALPQAGGEGPEHDGSQTREDRTLGNSLTVNQSRVDQMISYSQNGYLTADQMGKFQKARFDESRLRNPDLHLEGIAMLVTVAQAGIVFPPFSDGDKGIPVSTIRSFYGQEKLPDGYQKPEDTGNIFRVIGAMRHVMGNNGLGISDFIGDGLKYTGPNTQSASVTVKAVSLQEAVTALAEKNADSCPSSVIQAAAFVVNSNITFSCKDAATGVNSSSSLPQSPSRLSASIRSSSTGAIAAATAMLFVL